MDDRISAIISLLLLWAGKTAYADYVSRHDLSIEAQDRLVKLRLFITELDASLAVTRDEIEKTKELLRDPKFALSFLSWLTPPERRHDANDN